MGRPPQPLLRSQQGQEERGPGASRESWKEVSSSTHSFPGPQPTEDLILWAHWPAPPTGTGTGLPIPSLPLLPSGAASPSFYPRGEHGARHAAGA